MLRAVALSLFVGVFTMSLHATVTVKKVEYKGWPNCYRVSNGEVELIVTADVGPRIIRFGFVGGQNLFKEFVDQIGKSGEKEFQLRGGDRVWKAPEDPIATWAPDNVPVTITVTPAGLVARAPVEPLTMLQKEIEVSMAPSGEVTVSHRITNRSLFTLEFSPWTFTKKYMALRQDPDNSDAQKLGLFNPDTWAAYLLNGEAFVKRTKADPSKTYPDFGCSFETFTNNEFLEVETLGAMTKVLPSHTVEHVEHWSLYRNVKLPQLTDDAIDQVVLPLVHPAGNPH
jgi:hypothetical protein